VVHLGTLDLTWHHPPLQIRQRSSREPTAKGVPPGPGTRASGDGYDLAQNRRRTGDSPGNYPSGTEVSSICSTDTETLPSTCDDPPHGRLNRDCNREGCQKGLTDCATADASVLASGNWCSEFSAPPAAASRTSCSLMAVGKRSATSRAPRPGGVAATWLTVEIGFRRPRSPASSGFSRFDGGRRGWFVGRSFVQLFKREQDCRS
jgi:hypothetical protein